MNRIVINISVGLAYLSLIGPGVLVAKAQSETETVILESQLEVESAPVPDDLQAVIEAQIIAANQRDLEALMAIYSSNFRHEDGLDFDQTQQALTQIWELYSELAYSAKIKAWRQIGPDYEVTIVTEVEGVQTSARGDFDFKSIQEVRNRYRPDPEGLKLVSQAVVRESNSLKSGTEPPTVSLNLPDAVNPGTTYRLEAIVAEPLRNNVLLGAVLEEPADFEHYLESPSFQLEQLQAGGIFRQVDAPDDLGSSWLSVMFVGSGGITLHSHRVNVTNQLLLND